LLVYSYITSVPEHPASRKWLDEVLSGTTRVGLPWESIIAFLRIVTNPRVFSKPPTVKQAWAQVEEWLATPVVWVPLPTDQHSKILSELLHGSQGNLVHDAHLAALAIEHGLTLCSNDSDFARFKKVKCFNPLTHPEP
jgi:toxin-antitoxin system PIN domain toxin